MFNKKNMNGYYHQAPPQHHPGPGPGPGGQGGYYPNQNLAQIQYEMDMQNRKIRNLNRRVNRIEQYLGLRNDDMNDDNYLHD